MTTKCSLIKCTLTGNYIRDNFLIMLKSDSCSRYLNRKMMPLNQTEKLLTSSACQREYICLLITHWFFMISGLILIPVLAYLFPNEYRLPLNCYILLLPPNGLLFAWELNYAFMLVMAYSVILFTSCYMALPLILMNQTY